MLEPRTQIIPFPRAPGTRMERAEAYAASPASTFELCYVAAWTMLVGDLAELRPEQVHRMLDVLEVDNRRMAGQGAERLIRDRPDLHEAICNALDNVLHPDKWLRDEAALDELMGDLS